MVYAARTAGKRLLGQDCLQNSLFQRRDGDILVIKAGEVHSFHGIGDAPLVQVDVHLSPRFIQENLPG